MDIVDRSYGDTELNPAYEMLLTALCQTGLASTWGWGMPVADPDAARRIVVTHAAVFGGPTIQLLVDRLRQYVSHDRLTTPLEPLLCHGRQLDSVLHITATSSGLAAQLSGKDVLVWDAGKGSRMAGLLSAGQPKGDIVVTGSRKLYHFAAGVGQHMVGTLHDLNRDYVAFVASDQILCLSESDRRELTALLDAAASQNSDAIFFDGPPALSLYRLRFLLSSTQPPHRDGAMALARDRLLLKNYGGAHVLQCVVLKRCLVPALAAALEAILELARTGCNVDYGVNDIAILPRLIWPKYSKKGRRPGARQDHAALYELRARARRVRSVSMPLQVFNVNMPSVLSHLKTQIN